MLKSFHSFLLSVVIIHSSPMILNHGPVVINFDLEKCRRSNSCEALYSSNNINPTQLTIANIEFNAKSNKGGKIKLSTQSNASDKEINRNQTDATINTQENKERLNPATGILDVEFHNASKNYESKPDKLFNKTSEYSSVDVTNFPKKRNRNLTLTDKEKRTMDWYKERALYNNKEITNTDLTKWTFDDNNDGVENRKPSLNIENPSNSYSEINSNVIDSNEHVINKLNATNTYMDNSNIKTGVNNGINKLEMLYNAFKSNAVDKNNISTTELKATVNKYIADAPENDTIVLPAIKYSVKSDTQNVSSRISNTNETTTMTTEMQDTYIETTNQSINMQVIRFNDTNIELASNVQNNQTLKDINININGNETTFLNITELNATDSNYNNSMKQSTEDKHGDNYKSTWNQTVESIIKENKTYDTHGLSSTENGLLNVSNDKHDSDFKNQTDSFEFFIDVNETTTEFSADEYYRNMYNKTDKIRKTAIDSFIEIDKVSRSKRTQEFEALLSRMVSLRTEKNITKHVWLLKVIEVILRRL